MIHYKRRLFQPKSTLVSMILVNLDSWINNLPMTDVLILPEGNIVFKYNKKTQCTTTFNTPTTSLAPTAGGMKKVARVRIAITNVQKLIKEKKRKAILCNRNIRDA